MGNAHDSGIRVRPLDVSGAGRAFPVRVQAGFLLLTLLALLAGAGSFLVFWGAFWFVGESLRLAFGAGSQPLAPEWLIVPALLAAWGVLYLATDRLALLGSDAARETLWDKSCRFFAPWEPPPDAYFVEAKLTGGTGGAKMDLDLGFLFLLPERMVFVGDYYLLEVSRDAVHGRPTHDRDRLGLSAPYLSLPLADGVNRRLRVLCRGDATRQSETGPKTRRLEAAVNAWLAADPDYSPATGAQPPLAAER